MATDLELKDGGVADNVVIIGGNACARQIGEKMEARNVPVVYIIRETAAGIQPGANVLEKAGVTDCRGGVGDFTLSVRQNGKRFTQRAGAVVIAENGDLRPDHEAYGLDLSPRVRPLSEIANGDLPDTVRPGESVAVFLHGLARESNPATTRTVMNSALTLARDKDLKTYVLTRNLKVAGNGLEKLYRSAREAGVVFVKFTWTAPEIRCSHQEIQVSFTDEATGVLFTLTPDVAAVDEILAPSPAFKQIQAAFKLRTDSAGFLQADNVHRFPVETNRKGIFAAGPARGLLGEHAWTADAGAAAEALTTVLQGKAPDSAHKAEINRNQCVRCLTCYRVCTYRAVRIDIARPRVIPEACAGCGVCAAECPREAIRFNPYEPSAVSAGIVDARLERSEELFTVAFLCGRSAVPAREQAFRNGWNAPPGLFMIDVPCAGSISVNHLLGAFQAGAGGVLVIGCHPDNCHSENGTLHAKSRIKELQNIFDKIDHPRDRVVSASLAANMDAGFVRIVEEFENRIAGFGAPDK